MTLPISFGPDWEAAQERETNCAVGILRLILLRK
jgi:hypothetical protein